jgi:hypothetical protein
MSGEPAFLPLPIDADEGFPQAFLLAFLGATYVLSFYVNIAEGTAPDAQGFYELPADRAFMVLTVARQSVDGPVILTRRKLVKQQVVEAGELLLRFTAMKVARLNLNGVGPHGSVVKGEVAPRWAS